MSLMSEEQLRDVMSTALDHAECGLRATQRALTWGCLSPEQRDDLTRTANALELAARRIRGNFRNLRPIVEVL